MFHSSTILFLQFILNATSPGDDRGAVAGGEVSGLPLKYNFTTSSVSQHVDGSGTFPEQQFFFSIYLV